MFLRETADGLFRPIVYLGHKVGEEVQGISVASARARSVPLRQVDCALYA